MPCASTIASSPFARADYLATRDGSRYVVEVKTGAQAPRIETSATRRQILEYRIAFDVDGVVLVDAEAGSVHEMTFPALDRFASAGRGQGARGWRSSRWPSPRWQRSRSPRCDRGRVRDRGRRRRSDARRRSPRARPGGSSRAPWRRAASARASRRASCARRRNVRARVPRVLEHHLRRRDGKGREGTIGDSAGADHEEPRPERLHCVVEDAFERLAAETDLGAQLLRRARRALAQSLEDLHRLVRQTRKRVARFGDASEQRMEHRQREERRAPAEPLRVGDLARVREALAEMPHLSDARVGIGVPRPVHLALRIERAPERCRLGLVVDRVDEADAEAVDHRDGAFELHGATLQSRSPPARPPA